MKHVFVFMMLIVSLFVIYAVFSGRVPDRINAMPAVRATFAPVRPAQARPAVDPAGTVHRVIRSGNNLGRSTSRAFQGVNFGGKP